MNTMISNRHLSLWGVVIVALAVAILAGCKSDTKSATAPSPTTQPMAKAESAKGGAQLWAENCNRCHNVRSPASFSDAEWDVAVMHMRLRVPLTAQAQRSIVEFLKSGN